MQVVKDRCYTNNGITMMIMVCCTMLFFIIVQTGCSTITVSIRASAKSGKTEEKKGKLLREKEQMLEEFSPHALTVSLRKEDHKSVHVSVIAEKKQRIEIDKTYEKIGVYETYSMNPDAAVWDGVLFPASIIPAGAFMEPVFEKSEEKVEGEIKETESIIRDITIPVSGVTAFLNCGPAGQHKLVTDKNGGAFLDLTPLINRLIKDYDWTIVASASYEGLTATDSLRMNTTDLGVTWGKPRFQPELPPKIIATAKFKDQNNNQMLDAKERAILVVVIKNIGRGDAFHIDVKPEFTGNVEGVEMSPANQLRIETIAIGEEKSVEFSLSAIEEVPAQRFRVRMSFAELNGFEPAPLMVNLATRPYSPPKLALARWSLDDDNEGLSSGNGNRRLERGEQAEVTFFIQNLGAGAAENVLVEFKANDSNLYTKAMASDLGEIPPGEWRKAVFILRVNNRYNGAEMLPVDMEIHERRPKFALAQPLEIMLGQDVSKEKEVILAGDVRPALQPALSPLPKIERKKLMEINGLSRGMDYAVMIGINNYIDSEVNSLSYAETDIDSLYTILTDPQIGGYNKNSVFLMTPGSEQPQDRPTRTNILLTLKWLSENLKPEDSVLFVFCGHGDSDKNINYIIPFDGRLALPQDSSIRLSRLFEWLDACPARRQVVMLDACHSGGPSTLRRGNRGITVISTAFTEELQRIGAPEGRAVLSSSSIEEVSYEDPKLGHGVFTYYVLDGLKNFKADKNKDDRVTVYELGHFVQTEVKSWSKRNRKSPSQTPRMVYNDNSGEIVLAGSK